MALDGTLLRQIRHELEGVLIGARIDKIHHISRDEMIFILRRRHPRAASSCIFLPERTARGCT